MSDVNPDDLRKVRNGRVWVVFTHEGLGGYYLHPSRFRERLTPRDLERVAALAMMPRGTTVDGLGHVYPHTENLFILYTEEPNDE